MARTLEEMASIGAEKLRRKASIMARNWEAMKSIMKTHYDALPFGPTRKANYKAAIDAARYRAPDPDKWATNWKAKMSI